MANLHAPPPFPRRRGCSRDSALPAASAPAAGGSGGRWELLPADPAGEVEAGALLGAGGGSVPVFSKRKRVARRVPEKGPGRALLRVLVPGAGGRVPREEPGRGGRLERPRSRQGGPRGDSRPGRAGGCGRPCRRGSLLFLTGRLSRTRSPAGVPPRRRRPSAPRLVPGPSTSCTCHGTLLGLASPPFKARPPLSRQWHLRRQGWPPPSLGSGCQRSARAQQAVAFVGD